MKSNEVIASEIHAKIKELRDLIDGKNGVTDPLSPKSIDPSSSVALTPPLQIA